MAQDTAGARQRRGRLGRPTFKDAASGFVTGLFSIPEGMAYASVGGFAAPLGLWSGVVPTILGSMLARTVLMVTTLTSAIVFTSQSVLNEAGLALDDIGAIATMTVMTGLVMLLLGVLRLGSVMAFVSTAVMTGFTTGIAVQILAGVVEDATGYAPTSDNTVGEIVEGIVNIGAWDATTAAVAGGTVAIWAIARMFRPLEKFATLIALVVATVVTVVAAFDIEIVEDIAPIPRSLPPFTLPDPSAIPHLLTGAVAIALVALAQAAGISAAVANPDGSRADASQDFTAQGIANIGGGFFGALPTGGSLSRTGVATSAGAQTRWAGIFAGLSLGLIVLTVGPLAGAIPMAVIGGLMLVIGGELILGRLADIRLVLKTSVPSTVAMVLTFVATTALPLQQAIFIGATISILLTSVQSSRTGRLIELKRREDGGWEVADAPRALPSHRTTVVHYSGVGFFAEVGRLEQEWPDTDGATDAALVVSTRGSLAIPSATFLKMLDRKAERMREHGVALVICGVPDTLHDLLGRTGALDRIGPENVFAETERLMESVELGYARAEQLRATSTTQES
ncbi:SulP family inorganic anion transporter [Demequina activiva]|uniref:Sodium-independent anion transporter n=1 Tax=Demequina activiva TaxID=1582364 RepID=A0A919Q2V9_9MICO|nr:SulP family inorganic anion transporter [Demequina activiva]GIG54242.1 sodium-independent anion transporter [Demequina activiva]